MPARVLFVDDDQMLLSSMERCLGLKFDLETAISGPEALQKIENSAPFPVIVSDMRMPVMDGIQFINQARKISKQSIFLMLTGNQDVQTAIRAVNDGQVFRFLNKPSDPSDIAAAIELAQRQHDLESAERELLNKTFVGAIGIFADVMETLQPELLGRAAATEQFVDALREHVGVPPRWEFKIASKLALVGMAVHPRSGNLAPTSAQAVAHLARVCDTSAKMVERIPRMTLVCQIIRMIAESDGELPAVEPRGDGDVVRIGAALLRVAHLVEAMSHVGIDIDDAESDIEKCLPKIHPPLLEAARAVYPVEAAPDFTPVDVDDLQVGMVLHNNLVRPDGATLLRAGRRLSQTHIDKLQAEKQTLGEFPPVQITNASFQAAYPDAAVV